MMAIRFLVMDAAALARLRPIGPVASRKDLQLTVASVSPVGLALVVINFAIRLRVIAMGRVFHFMERVCVIVIGLALVAQQM